MKNAINTLTVLLLLLGIGLVIPKMIPMGAVAATRSHEDRPSEDPSAPLILGSEEKAKTDAIQGENPENETAEASLTENGENRDDNFPIKTAGEDIAVPDKDAENPTDSTSYVDNNDANNDNTETDAKDIPAKVAVNANETKKAAEEVKQAPAELKITYTSVTYTRWVIAPLNMRTGPGKDYGLITSIPMAEAVTVTSMASNGWAKVLFGGKEGFVSGKYLSETEVKKPVAASPPATSVQKPQASKPLPSTYEAYKMYVGGKTITYKNGGVAEGQRIIDSSSKLISTWGGAETFSGNDGYNTHFIGHNPGIFSVLTQVGHGSTIIVTDKSGQPTIYKVTRIFTVDDYADNAKDGKNYYNYMVSRNGGEVITLQTCLGTNKNLVIRAEK